jgi:hypothetical protein
MIGDVGGRNIGRSLGGLGAVANIVANVSYGLMELEESIGYGHALAVDGCGYSHALDVDGCGYGHALVVDCCGYCIPLPLDGCGYGIPLPLDGLFEAREIEGGQRVFKLDIGNLGIISVKYLSKTEMTVIKAYGRLYEAQASESPVQRTICLGRGRTT